jgi:hypothetical protein
MLAVTLTLAVVGLAACAALAEPSYRSISYMKTLAPDGGDSKRYLLETTASPIPPKGDTVP